LIIVLSILSDCPFGIFISTDFHFQNGRHNAAKNQHCSISKVSFDLFFKPVVSDRFGRLERNRTILNLCGIVAAILKMATGRNFSMSKSIRDIIIYLHMKCC
jgi:hypothetical protein